MEGDGKMWSICFSLIGKVAEVPEGWKGVNANSSFTVFWGQNVPVSLICPVELLPAHDDKENLVPPSLYVCCTQLPLYSAAK